MVVELAAGGLSEWLPVLGTALLGCILSPVTEALIAKLLPRLGTLPRLSVRITTAALTGIAFGAFAVRFNFDNSLPAFFLLAVLGVQLARIDIALHLLPNPLVLALLTGGLLLFILSPATGGEINSLLRGALGAVILFPGYLILGLISPGGIGMGDVKLAAPVGLYLGYLGWSELLYGGLLGFILNGAGTIFLLSRKGRKRATEVAHGPAMLGALAATALLFR